MRYLGIDVQKGQSHYYLQEEDGRKVVSGRVETRPARFAELVEKSSSSRGVAVALETGNVSFSLSRSMHAAGADVFVVDTYQNALIARSTKKTDRLDARCLSDQRRLGMLPHHRVYVPSLAAEELRRLVSARARLIKERTALSNRAIRVADRYACPVRRGTLSWSKGWWRLQVASSGWSEADRFLLAQYSQDFERLHEQIRQIEKLITERLACDFERVSTLLMTIPGIGLITTAALCSQVEDIGRFGSARQLCRYLGLTPSVRHSGLVRRDGHICKSGNGRLRGYLTQAALQVIRHASADDPLRLWYEGVRRRRGWRKARVALARKLAAIAFGVWRHGQAYDPKLVSATLAKQKH